MPFVTFLFCFEFYNVLHQVFDVMMKNMIDVIDLPLYKRKEILNSSFKTQTLHESIRLSEYKTIQKQEQFWLELQKIVEKKGEGTYCKPQKKQMYT